MKIRKHCYNKYELKFYKPGKIQGIKRSIKRAAKGVGKDKLKHVLQCNPSARITGKSIELKFIIT